MTLSDTATAQLRETFRAGGGAELVRDAVLLVLQELIEAAATEVIGAARYERSDARVTERNGHRPRLLATRAGDVELMVPKLRQGSLVRAVRTLRRTRASTATSRRLLGAVMARARCHRDHRPHNRQLAPTLNQGPLHDGIPPPRPAK